MMFRDSPSKVTLPGGHVWDAAAAAPFTAAYQQQASAGCLEFSLVIFPYFRGK
jgi:hypothetical protein